MKKILTLVVGLLMLFKGFGQDEPFRDTYEDLNTRKNGVYFEGLGNGGYASLNYERLFFRVPQRVVAIRAGVSFSGDSGKINVVIPLELTLLFGYRNCFETGPGITFSPGAEDFFFFYRIGYRLRTDRGVLIRVAPMLVYLPGWYIGPYGGVSIGLSF